MRARLLKILNELANAFWVGPAALVIALSLLGVLAVNIQHWPLAADWLPANWIYGGGETGARTLLGAIASSTIAVAGTMFSITIAALTLASTQMGPRLLRNFMRDRGNQITLGVLLGTFGYALVVLRSVRGGEEEAFVPALGVTIGLALAAACVGLLIYFVNHVASRINVDTVIDLVYDDVIRDLHRTTSEDEPPASPAVQDWAKATAIYAQQSGYLQQVDTGGLIKCADEANSVIRRVPKAGDFVYAGGVLALTTSPTDEAEKALRSAIALSSQPGAPGDPTFAILQLVEVAVRALSPGINDPRTAISVLDRLGAILAFLSNRHMPPGVFRADGQVRLLVSAHSYSDVVDAMFSMIRQSASTSAAVLEHMLHVLGVAMTIERRVDRLAILKRHADAVLEQARLGTLNVCDYELIEARHGAIGTSAPTLEVKS